MMDLRKMRVTLKLTSVGAWSDVGTLERLKESLAPELVLLWPLKRQS